MKKCITVIARILMIAAAAVVLCGIIVVFIVTQTDKVNNVRHGVVHLCETTNNLQPVVNKVISAVSGRYDNTRGKCSTAVKKLKCGDTVAGRNMDTAQSNHPIYIGSTKIEGFYPTVYATFLGTLGPTYASCVGEGVPKYISAIAPFVATDSLNSEGLYMQMNMRTNQKDEQGNFVFSCSGTNKESPVRMNACELPSYVTMRCKNTAEAVALINTLDVYTTYDHESWTACFIIADAQDDCGLLELGCNEMRWLPGQTIQTNFYISEDLNQLQKYKNGLGRYDYLEKNIGNVDSEADMLSLMDGVRYSEIYNLDNPEYDIRSEFAGDEEYLTNEYLENDDNWAAFVKTYKADVEEFYKLYRDEKERTNDYWISLYTTIANCSKKHSRSVFLKNAVFLMS